MPRAPAPTKTATRSRTAAFLELREQLLAFGSSCARQPPFLSRW